MSITAEQFNKLVLKEDLKRELDILREELASRNQIEKLQNTMDSIVKDHSKFDEEKIANQGAHDRTQGEIDTIKEKIEVPMVNDGE